MFAVVRSYTGASELIEAMDRQSAEVERVIATTPGFVSYHAVRSGEALVTVTVCQDRQGTEETTRRAADWVRANVPGGVPAPQVASGEVFVSFAAPAGAMPAMRAT